MTEIIRTDTGEILDTADPSDLTMLDIYSAGPIADEAPRMGWLATLSAGYRQIRPDGTPGAPVVSRDGTIYLSDPNGRAPKLKAALAARENRALTLAFPFDNPSAFVQQRFALYSASKLLAYGDEDQLSVINDQTGGRRILAADTDEYNEVRARCKVSISIYFALADWRADGTPVVEFPDGLGLYRIRTTSRNTLRSLRASLHHVGAFTGGRIAGVPFEAALEYRDVAGPDGTRHSVPVWTFTMKPPATLSSRTFVPTLTAALAEGRRLQLPPPTAEGLADAEWDFEVLGGDDELPVSQPTEQDVALLAEGGRCDARAYEQRWFAIVRRTYLDSDEARAEYLRHDTHGRFDSLARFLAEATEQQAQAFIMRVAQDVDRWRQRERKALDLTGVDDDYRPMRPADIVDLDPEPEEPTPPVPIEMMTFDQPTEIPDDADQVPSRRDDPHVTSTRDPAWQFWLRLVREAEANSVDAPMLTPPSAVPLRLSELRAHAATLQAALRTKTGASGPR